MIRLGIFNTVFRGTYAEQAEKIRAAGLACVQLWPPADEPLTPGRGPQYQEDRYMDLSRIRTDAGFQPEVSLDEGIGAYVEWLRDQRLFIVTRHRGAR